MSHRDKARIFSESSRTAAKFLQPSTPPHHGVDSRRSAAMATAHAAGDSSKTPYGKGYAKNSASGPLKPMSPAEKGSHPIPAHPGHPRAKRPKNPTR